MTSKTKMIVNRQTVIDALQLYFDQKVFQPTCPQQVKNIGLETSGRGYNESQDFVIEIERTENRTEPV